MPKPTKPPNAVKLAKLLELGAMNKVPELSNEAKAVKNCLANLTDKSKPPRARAEYFLLFVNEIGYDLIEPVTDLVKKLDKQTDLEKKVVELANTLKKIEEEGKTGPLQPEIYFSTDDVQFHKAFFTKRAFSVSLVFGLSPREEDKVRIYGFTDGIVKERSLWLVD